MPCFRTTSRSSGTWAWSAALPSRTFGSTRSPRAADGCSRQFGRPPPVPPGRPAAGIGRSGALGHHRSSRRSPSGMPAFARSAGAFATDPAGGRSVDSPRSLCDAPRVFAALGRTPGPGVPWGQVSRPDRSRRAPTALHRPGCPGVGPTGSARLRRAERRLPYPGPKRNRWGLRKRQGGGNPVSKLEMTRGDGARVLLRRHLEHVGAGVDRRHGASGHESPLQECPAAATHFEEVGIQLSGQADGAPKAG